MAVDLATLSVRISNAQAIADAQATGAAFEQMGNKGEAAQKKLVASSNPVTQAIKQQAIDYTQLTARAMDFARAGASAAQVSQMAGVSMTQAAAAVKAYAGTVSKAEIDVGGLKAAQAQLALANIAVGESAAVASTGFNLSGLNLGRLRQSFASAIAMMTGMPPIVTRIGSTLGAMTLGMGDVVLAMAAIAAVVWVFDKLTEGSRKAMEIADKLAESYNKLARVSALGIGGQQRADIEDINKGLEEHAKWLGALIALRIRLGALGGIVFGISGHADAITTDTAARAAAEQQRVNEIGLQNARDNQAWADRIAKEKQAAAEAERRAQEAQIRESDLVRSYGAAGQPMTRAAGLAASRGTGIGPAEQAELTRQLGFEFIAPKITIPAVRMGDSLTDLQKQIEKLINPVILATEAHKKFVDMLVTSRARLADVAEQFKHGNILAGAQSGAEGAVADALSQFTPQAIAFKGVTTIINNVAEGVSIFAKSLLDGGAAAAEYARALRQQRDEYAAAVAQFKGDDLAAQIAQIAANFEQLVKQMVDTVTVHDVLSGKTTPASVQQQKADLAAQEARNQALATQRFAEQQQYSLEDLQVRLLSAQGQDRAAAALKLKYDQARERQALIDSFGPEIDATEAATLSLLDQVQAQEKLKAATDAANTSALNMVSGYRLQATIFNAMAARNPGAPIFPGVNPLGPSTTPSRLHPPGTMSVVLSGGTIDVVGLDGVTIGKAVLKNFKGTAQRQYGDSSRWSEIQ